MAAQIVAARRPGCQVAFPGVIRGVLREASLAADQAMNIPRGGFEAVLKGRAGVNAVADELEQAGFTVTREVRMSTLPEGGLETRLDLFVRKGLQEFFVEVKNGASASLTANQGMLFPVLWDSGLYAQGTAAAEAGLSGLRILPGFVVWLS